MTVIIEVIGPTPPTPPDEAAEQPTGIDAFTLARITSRRPRSAHDKCASNAGLS